MNIRQIIEETEKKILSPYAKLSSESLGRPEPMEEDDLRTCFHRDRDRIIHSKAFRRLKHKTQVFSSYEYNDHLRTRITHTMEVNQVARTIARALRLNEDLTEAIALGHDMGHTAFGHAGEAVLDEIFDGFNHNENSAKIASELNLSKEVIDGILKHSTTACKEDPITLEGKIVRYSDKIAYLNADLDDGIRMGLIKETDIPDSIKHVLGNNRKERLATMIYDMIKVSTDKPYIKMSGEIEESFNCLKKFMYENLYYNKVLREKDTVVKKIFYEIYENELKIGKDKEKILEFISGMTDTFAIKYFMDMYNINPFGFNFK